MNHVPSSSCSADRASGVSMIALAVCGLACIPVGCNDESSVAIQQPSPAPMMLAPADDREMVRRNGVPEHVAPAIDLTAPGIVQRTTVTPVIIDTRAFDPAITVLAPFDGEPMSTSTYRPEKIGKKDVPVGAPNTLPEGGMMAESRVEPGGLFPGIQQTPWSPPDPALAVGPEHIVETVNMAIAFYTKDGTLQFSQNLDSTGSPGFFEDIGGGDFTFDPKCFYDQESERFVVVALEVYGSTEAWITMAVSDDSDPNGLWYKYRTWAVIAVGDTDYWVDYPGFGFDDQAFYVTGNLFKLSGPGSGFGGALFRSFDKQPMLAGNPVVLTDVRDGGAASVQAAQHFGSPAGPYFVSRENSTTLLIHSINDPLGSPTLSTATVAIPSQSGPDNDAPNMNGGQIDTLDGRIMNVHWRNGNLYACHAIDAPGGRTQARWYHIATGNWPVSGSPSLVQSGNIDVGNGVHIFFPAIYSNTFDDVGMVVARSAANEFASVQATGRLSTDPLGEMGALTELTIGSAGANGRWGDYFDIAVDPVDDTLFWMVGEYAGPSGWQTWIGSFEVSVSCPADIAGGPGVDTQDLLVLLAAWGTDGAGAGIAAPFDQVDVADLLALLALWGDC